MRKRCSWTPLSLILLLVTLAGCMPGSGGTARLAPLHSAHLQRLDAVSNLSQENGKIARATLFQQGAAAQQLLLTVVGEVAETGLAVVDLDGAHERQVPLTHECSSPPAVTSDGQWVACVSDLPDGAADHLEVASLRVGDSRHWEIPFSAPSAAYQLAWSPDGKYLALGGPASATQCAFDIYTTQSDYTRFSLVISLTTPAFSEVSPCQLGAIGWSPDSARLLVAIVEGGTAVFVDEQTPVAKLIQRGTTAYAISAHEFTSLGTSQGMQYLTYNLLAWNPRTGALAFVASGSVWIVAAGGTARSVLFTIPDKYAYLYDAEWSPDGSKLALVIGPHQCLDCNVTALPDVYLYTPPNGE